MEPERPASPLVSGSNDQCASERAKTQQPKLLTNGRKTVNPITLIAFGLVSSQSSAEVQGLGSRLHPSQAAEAAAAAAAAVAVASPGPLAAGPLDCPSGRMGRTGCCYFALAVASGGCCSHCCCCCCCCCYGFQALTAHCCSSPHWTCSKKGAGGPCLRAASLRTASSGPRSSEDWVRTPPRASTRPLSARAPPLTGECARPSTKCSRAHR